MTETQHPSELESAMDNLETLLEAVAVARQKVRDRQRRAVPNRAPRRPEPEPVDWVEDAEEERAPGSEEASEQEPDSGAESAEDEQNAEAETAALLPGEGGAALPPASAEVRQLMAEMALTIKHDQAVGNALRESVGSTPISRRTPRFSWRTQPCVSTPTVQRRKPLSVRTALRRCRHSEISP